MAYKNRLIFLLSLIAILALTYAASLIFSPERSVTRNASFFWLDPKLAVEINRISINTEWEEIELVRRNSQWFVLLDGTEYPARQLRVEDFISIFTTRAAWPVRSYDDSTHTRLGLNAQSTSRITFYGDNAVLLDLLHGYDDRTGSGMYIRKYAQSEVRSGDHGIRTYLSSSIVSWFNLRLVPESENNHFNSGSVQRVSIYHNGQSQVFARSNREWIISGIEVADPDYSKIENYIWNILNSEGDIFIDARSVDDSMFNHSRIVIEFGDGTVKNIRFSEPDESGRCMARVSSFVNALVSELTSGDEYVYSISAWVSARLFRDADSFQR